MTLIELIRPDQEKKCRNWQNLKSTLNSVACGDGSWFFVIFADQFKSVLISGKSRSSILAIPAIMAILAIFLIGPATGHHSLLGVEAHGIFAQRVQIAEE